MEIFRQVSMSECTWRIRISRNPNWRSQILNLLQYSQVAVGKRVVMKVRNLLLSVALLVLTGCAQNGLHNSTKSFTPILEMSPLDWSDPVEIDRTWQAALVRIPKPDGGYVSTTISKLQEEQFKPEGVWPTVIYLHGCSGIWSGTKTRINFLAKNGFAVIAPASLARLKYPRSCNTKTHQGGFYKPTLKMRQYDAGYAIKMAKTLSWVDSSNVFLMGLSQGGITTATFEFEPSEYSVRARVVEGWTCRTGWTDYSGINAPETEPVLTLLGEKDPWFQNYNNRGSCDLYLNQSNGSRSVVYTEGHLRYRHELLESKAVQKVVLDFLNTHRSR